MTDRFSLKTYAFFIFALLAVMLLCVCIGSVSVAPKDTLTAVFCTLLGKEVPAGISKNIILNVRLPRVLNVALVGAALSLCGAAMQGLLRNPLADGSTLGVSSGASLGAVIALALGVTVPGSEYGGTMLMAMAFAFLSLVLILSLAYALDHSLATNSIILIGVIFSMFISSVINLILSFLNDQVRSITFWTMGSLSGTGYAHTRILSLALLICGGVIFRYARELNAFAIGEDNARHIGVNVRRVKLVILITVSVMIGVCVSIGGSIGFVGLVVPHMARMIAGPNHRRLLPASMFSGAIFLLLADLIARTLLSPVELSIGVVTSLVGAALSLCGAAMQGLLRNPLADGSTLGVSSGASLGAVIALALGVTVPGSEYGGTMLMAMAFAFLSLVLILSLAYALDHSLATNSIILIGVIFSMFISSVINLILSFLNDQVRSITFWTMGSLSGTGYAHTRILSLALLICGGVIFRYARELNAFAIGEDNARHIGVNVRRVKLVILITVSVMIGVCVSIGGSIGFVGLVVPHMARMIAGPNHRRLLPASMFSGAIFLLLADLIARTLLSPVELSIGVVTSLVGAAAFVVIFYRARKAG